MRHRYRSRRPLIWTIPASRALTPVHSPDLTRESVRPPPPSRAPPQVEIFAAPMELDGPNAAQPARWSKTAVDRSRLRDTSSDLHDRNARIGRRGRCIAGAIAAASPHAGFVTPVLTSRPLGLAGRQAGLQARSAARRRAVTSRPTPTQPTPPAVARPRWLAGPALRCPQPGSAARARRSAPARRAPPGPGALPPKPGGRDLWIDYEVVRATRRRRRPTAGRPARQQPVFDRAAGMSQAPRRRRRVDIPAARLALEAARLAAQVEASIARQRRSDAGLLTGVGDPGSLALNALIRPLARRTTDGRRHVSG
jgi:hypothetical protein